MIIFKGISEPSVSLDEKEPKNQGKKMLPRLCPSLPRLFTNASAPLTEITFFYSFIK